MLLIVPSAVCTGCSTPSGTPASHSRAAIRSAVWHVKVGHKRWDAHDAAEMETRNWARLDSRNVRRPDTIAAGKFLLWLDDELIGRQQNRGELSFHTYKYTPPTEMQRRECAARWDAVLAEAVKAVPFVGVAMAKPEPETEDGYHMPSSTPEWLRKAREDGRKRDEAESRARREQYDKGGPAEDPLVSYTNTYARRPRG